MKTPKKILVVEDDPTFQKVMREKLTREGFDITIAGDGEEGLAVANTLRPKLIILDILMPKMDGITMLQKLRALNTWGSKVPAIILTNLSPEDKDRIKQLGDLAPKYYIIKVDHKLNDIVEKVKKVLG